MEIINEMEGTVICVFELCSLASTNMFVSTLNGLCGYAAAKNTRNMYKVRSVTVKFLYCR